jgi:hypothetical protein
MHWFPPSANSCSKCTWQLTGSGILLGHSEWMVNLLYLAVRCSSMLRVTLVARHSYAPEARMATLGCQGAPFQDCPDFSKAATLHYLVLDTDRLRWDMPRLLRYCLNPDPSSWLARHQALCHENPSHLSPLEPRDHPPTRSCL